MDFQESATLISENGITSNCKNVRFIQVSFILQYGILPLVTMTFSEKEFFVIIYNFRFTLFYIIYVKHGLIKSLVHCFNIDE